MVHFLMAEALVHDRERELRRTAARPRTTLAARRRRFGWKLVDVGLRLALSPQR
ncbi:hypothetical protein FHX82_003505 [Amycolatopsis bartoniae]|uniref:Uncharacterized protein n=1 Tax=Amycolatopsis bartoniae TaxID=941986 RepID=A0A8H9IZC0_9PSEU|nr:hypothetical protein [Amycolatopsis bartoniae]MBB2936441.1 hypothetical protein [Amycolatopsis bartoniae]GHF68933.1 hypothetical protein GCM10017566_48490 [Amycolatopsis bartoniae]